MDIQTSRYLMLVGKIGFVLSIGMGYQLLKPAVCPPVASSFAMQSLQDMQLPSVISNFRLAAKRHLFFPVDLRRADLLLGIQPDSDKMVMPVLDKVLYVPKKFTRGFDS